MPMKKPWLAFALSVIVPGAGLAYLGHWLWGAINLAAFLAALALISLVFSDTIVGEEIHYVMAALAAASGGWAHAWCVQHNGSVESDLA